MQYCNYIVKKTLIFKICIKKYLERDVKNYEKRINPKKQKIDISTSDIDRADFSCIWSL
jgi:hypothetical protein